MPKPRKEISDIEKLIRDRHKKFVRYEEGAKLYSMGFHSFQQLAKDAKAVYHIKKGENIWWLAVFLYIFVFDAYYSVISFVIFWQ